VRERGKKEKSKEEVREKRGEKRRRKRKESTHLPHLQSYDM